MAKKTGLGKGLDALLPVAEEKIQESGIKQIPTEKILPNPRQPRADIDSKELDQLAVSISKHGILQPLIITAGDTPGSYILIPKILTTTWS